MNQRIIAEIDQHDMKAVLKPADEPIRHEKYATLGRANGALQAPTFAQNSRPTAPHNTR